MIAGNRVADGPDSRYFEARIAPHIDEVRVQYVGPVDDEQKNRLLGEAAALLMPIDWEEPFGIVMAEACACGTPVIAFARGSVPEVIRDGVNGFACGSVDDGDCRGRRRSTASIAEPCAPTAKPGSADRVIADAYESLYRELDRPHAEPE